jgi:hypothetical protein
MSLNPLGPWSRTDIYSDTVFLRGSTITSIVSGVKTVNYLPYSYPLVSSALREGVNTLFVVPRPPTHSKLTLNSYQNIEGKFLCRPWEASAVIKDLNWAGDNKLLVGQGIGQLPVLSDAPLGDVTTAKNYAFQKVIQKQASALKALSVLGEFGDTYRSARSLMELLSGAHNKATKSLVKTIIKNRSASVPALLAIISDLWLEYNFNVLPTVLDINALVKTVNSDVDAMKPSTGIRGSFVVSSMNNSAIVSNPDPSFAVMNTKTIQYKTTVKMGYTIRTECVNKVRLTGWEAYGFSLGEVIPALWEITPYSWLAGYFSNINDFFNLTALHRGVSECGWIVVRRETMSSVGWQPLTQKYYNGGPNKSGALESSSPGYCTAVRLLHTRDPFDCDTFIPDFQLRVPNLGQAANVAALLGSRLIRPSNMLRLFPASQARSINEVLAKWRYGFHDAIF